MNTLTQDVQAATSGDEKAFERIIDTCKNTVTSIALSIVKDVDASEEVAQKVFINCWQNLSTLNKPDSFLPWVRQTSRHMSLNYLRDNKVNQRASSDEADRVFAEFCSNEHYLEQELNSEQCKLIVQRLIDDLPPESREVVLLYYREQAPSQHVANLLGISEASVRKKLSRARATLKDRLIEKYGRVILSTVPAVSFASITLATATASPKALAAVSMSQQSSWMGKLSFLFSGAMLASFMGVLAVFLSHKMVEKRLEFESDKHLLRQVRNVQIAWLLVFGVVFGLSYQLSDGYIWPVTTYTIFAVGLSVLIRRAQQIAVAGINRKSKFLSDKDQQDPSASDKPCNNRWAAFGLYGGLLIGFVGLFAGLVGSGRLVL